MSASTLLWTPPSLCGCQLRITAEWTDNGHDGVSYRHPTPFTISRIELVSVCAAHLMHTRTMPDTSRFFEAPTPGGVEHFLLAKSGGVATPVQRRGYLKYPIASPTDAECLYTFLSLHRGQVRSLPCGCATFQHFDEANHAENPNATPTHRMHPLHSRQCKYHQGDTLDMAQASADHAAYMTAQPAAARA